MFIVLCVAFLFDCLLSVCFCVIVCFLVFVAFVLKLFVALCLMGFLGLV